ncbi:hypothetical protein PO883_34295 [Massilia sp. DJPM01]|uniref:hypothetical protein n=1 Tax=Massilia sp. DJPM01 TaxID=3024404 RepID=UPI00259EBF65|nr:hypothetical protein [Massilia sp. DJPM01]MDM5182240.1 hypothetical protein [Massilia sp. DJPM01]
MQTSAPKLVFSKVKVSTGSEHDPLHVEAVLGPSNTNRNVLRGKGYVDGEREDRLTQQGWRMHIERKGSRTSQFRKPKIDEMRASP